MALPIVAIVGRPNVGKSSLVNRIVASDEAIVDPTRGVTRDRSYHEADWNGVSFMLVDTGGIEVGSDDAFQASISAQALEAVDEADVILFVVDGRSGVLEEDQAVAKILRRAASPVLVAVNKMDTPNALDDLWEFYNLGLGDPWPVSAVHGYGTGDLLDAVVEALPDSEDDEETDEGIAVAIIGRPNAGKSSLFNALAGRERSIVADGAGTTRDAIDTFVTHDEVTYRMIDTAGLRKKSAMEGSIEYYGFVRAMRAIDRADVTLLVIDASLGLTNEDQRVAGYAADRGRAMAILINKVDLIDADALEALKARITDRMTFVGYAPLLPTSALTGRGVERIWTLIDEIYQSYTAVLPTSALNRFLSRLKETGVTVSRGKAHLRLKYVTQTATAPPQLVFFANRPDLVDENYRRYLDHQLRAAFPLEGTPVRLRFKKGD